MKKIPIVALLVFLISCASAPNLGYYTLDMTPSKARGGGANLVVDRFTVSEKLDRHQIVIQQSPTRVSYYATERWASSVGEMVEHKLAAEFGPVDADRRSLIVEGNIVAFEQIDATAGPVARVGFEITIRDGDSKRYETPLLKKSYEVEQPASDNNVDAVVQALSRAVEEIATQITVDAAVL
jgi:uncharacterized lipoprotein YmbA